MLMETSWLPSHIIPPHTHTPKTYSENMELVSRQGAEPLCQRELRAGTAGGKLLVGANGAILSRVLSLLIIY